MPETRKIFVPAVLDPTDPSTRLRVQQTGNPFTFQTTLETIASGLPSGGIPDAPADTTSYGRVDHRWERVLAITGDTFDGGNF
jgi:hypothetical protein